MRELRFISVQPANLYYAWQVEVMLHNFLEMGVKPEQIDILCYKENGIVPRQWLNLYSVFGQQGVSFYFYNDERTLDSTLPARGLTFLSNTLLYSRSCPGRLFFITIATLFCQRDLTG